MNRLFGYSNVTDTKISTKIIRRGRRSAWRHAPNFRCLKPCIHWVNQLEELPVLHLTFDVWSWSSDGRKRMGFQLTQKTTGGTKMLVQIACLVYASSLCLLMKCASMCYSYYKMRYVLLILYIVYFIELQQSLKMSHAPGMVSITCWSAPCRPSHRAWISCAMAPCR